MKIIKNFLPDPLFKTIKTMTMESDFPYYYMASTADPNDDSYFFFVILLYKDKQTLSDHLMPIVIQ